MSEEDNTIQIISSSESLEALNRAEVDMQIATAKRWPMHSSQQQIQTALVKAEAFALVDSETAESCFYRLERTDKETGQKSIIEGPSIRLAEIIANSWGNLRIATRIIGNDGKFVTAQGACHDLESNVAQSVEVKRSITTKKGYTFSADMQVVTGNAAASIARRNAILAVIPAAIFKTLYSKIKKAAIGEVSNNLEKRRANMLKTYALAGVNSETICKYLDVSSVDEIDAEMVVNLASLWNALRDGQTTIEETFEKPANEAKKAEQIRKKNAEAKGRIAASAAGSKAQKQTAGQPQQGDNNAPAGSYDPETGELFQQQ
ncbi:MAG: hypothetical protein IKX67_07345 [Bacteroidales bacterium]|nr:hypothetical protein [Bacteroidales bacterium]